MTVAQIIAEAAELPRLVAPERFRGRLYAVKNQGVVQERVAWIREQAAKGYTPAEIAAATGLHVTSVRRPLAEDRKVHKRGRTRAAVRWRGLEMGNVESAVQALSDARMDALERRCARSGETFAEALVAHWMEAGL